MKKQFFLFGEDAVNAYETNGDFDSVLPKLLSLIDVNYIAVFNEDTPAIDVLRAYDGFYGYAEITEMEYAQIYTSLTGQDYEDTLNQDDLEQYRKEASNGK